ncbi:hypothetical protein MVES_001946 [Malassezia vespertilionis]|uniref:Uncharacterized protein n=1 Tax=Malassezia vespertilionis TaxID=2020962 RepID=A0A2N1JCB4_9BASI|nr:hypothetical protein MVES_001946 [Malassezia vespertilionis]
MFAGAPSPSPLEQSLMRVQARRTVRSFAVIVGLLHFSPYIFHYLGDILRRA